MNGEIDEVIKRLEYLKGIGVTHVLAYNQHVDLDVVVGIGARLSRFDDGKALGCSMVAATVSHGQHPLKCFEFPTELTS